MLWTDALSAVPDIAALGWLWLAVLSFGAAFIRGYSGFGFAAILITGASLVTDPALLVPVVILCELALTAPQWASIRGDIDWRRVAVMFLLCLLGVPLGVRAVAALGPDMMRAAISVWVLVMGMILLRGWRMARPAGLPAHGVVGFLAGLANGAAVGGLPVAVFFAAQPISAAAFRATLVAYFALLDLYTVGIKAKAGLMTATTLLLAGIGLPFMALGLRIGSSRFLAAPPEGFRRFATLVLMALAVMGLLRAAW